MEHALIIITGHPGSGKTTLAQQLSRTYHVPYVSKDGMKERIFDALGSRDKAWSLQVSAAAHRIMDDWVRQQLQSGGSVIVESNFKRDKDSVRFTEIAQACDARCMQILCQADGAVLFERWNARIANGSRHEGHVEKISLDQIREELAQPYPPLDVPGTLFTIDTTDPGSMQLPKL